LGDKEKAIWKWWVRGIKQRAGCPRSRNTGIMKYTFSWDYGQLHSDFLFATYCKFMITLVVVLICVTCACIQFAFVYKLAFPRTWVHSS
jgi:hypothetical protein